MLSFVHYPITPLLAVAGITLDALLGEPRRRHPLVGFGNLAHGIEARLNPDPAVLQALYAIFDDKRHPYYEHREAA